MSLLYALDVIDIYRQYDYYDNEHMSHIGIEYKHKGKIC